MRFIDISSDKSAFLFIISQWLYVILSIFIQCSVFYRCHGDSYGRSYSWNHSAFMMLTPCVTLVIWAFVFSAFALLPLTLQQTLNYDLFIITTFLSIYSNRYSAETKSKQRKASRPKEENQHFIERASSVTENNNNMLHNAKTMIQTTDLLSKLS